MTICMSKIYQCCFCQDYFKGYGHNPQPVNMEEGARCCDFCNSTVVIPARMSKIYGSEQNKISNPTFMTVYIRDSPDDSPSDSINYYVGEIDADIEDGSPCPLCNPEGNNDNYLEVEATDHFSRDWAYSCDNCDFEVEMSNRPQITKIEPTGNFVYTESTDEFTSFDDMRGQHLFSADGENPEEWGNERTSAVLAGVFATALEGLMSKLNTAIDEKSEIEILFFTDCIDYLCSGMASTLAENSKEMDSEIVNAIGGMLAMTALQMDKLRTNPEIEDAMNPMPEPPTDSIVDVVVEDANDFGNSLDLDMWTAENETSLLIMEQDLCPVCRGEEELEMIEYPSELCFEHSEAWDDMMDAAWDNAIVYSDDLYDAEAFDEKVTVWYCGRCSMAHGSDQNAAEICCTAEDPYSDENQSKASEEDYDDIVKISRFMKYTSNAGIPYDDWYWDGEELTIIGFIKSDEVEKYTKEELIELGVLESSIPSKSFDAETMKKFYDELAGLLNRTAGNNWDIDGDSSESSRELDVRISMESLPATFFEDL